MEWEGVTAGEKRLIVEQGGKKEKRCAHLSSTCAGNGGEVESEFEGCPPPRVLNDKRPGEEKEDEDEESERVEEE